MEGAKTQLNRAKDKGDQTKDALLYQYINLRRMYETTFADNQNKYPGLSVEDINNSICGTKAGVNGGDSPAEHG